jgi:membrane protein implicated in regulation of membrane protease activity
MSQARIDAVVIAGLIFVWIGIFVASSQGKSHVSGLASDGLLAVLAVLIAYRLWRVYRRWDRKGA